MLLLNRASFKNTVRSVRNKAYRFLQLCDVSLDKLTTTVLSISMKGVIVRHTVAHFCKHFKRFVLTSKREE